jgi:hypothetical protein
MQAYEDDYFRIKAAFKLFDALKCCSSGLKGDIHEDDYYVMLEAVDEDKMRCHIFNCWAALYLMQMQIKKQETIFENGKCKLVKRKVFTATVIAIMNDEFDSDQNDIKTILSIFPDERKMTDDRS